MSRKKSIKDKKILIEIGARIRSIRKYLDLTQVEFGQSIGISSNYLSNLENGNYCPTDPVLISIQHRYSINPQEILTGDGFSLNNVGSPRVFKGVAEPREQYNHVLPSLLQMAKTVLESKTEFANALATNIRAFFNSLQKQQRLEDRLASLEKKIESMESALANHTHSGIKG